LLIQNVGYVSEKKLETKLQKSWVDDKRLKKFVQLL
jgi:hypothetical protein